MYFVDIEVISIIKATKIIVNKMNIEDKILFLIKNFINILFQYFNFLKSRSETTISPDFEA